MFPWEKKEHAHTHTGTDSHPYPMNSLLNPHTAEYTVILAFGDCWHPKLVFTVGNKPFTREIPSLRDQ